MLSEKQSMGVQITAGINKSGANQSTKTISQGNRCVELPVFYSRESGPDLELLAENAGLSVDQVIALHQQTEYRVYAIGFAPGFAYLGEVDSKIAHLDSPLPDREYPRVQLLLPIGKRLSIQRPPQVVGILLDSVPRQCLIQTATPVCQ